MDGPRVLLAEDDRELAGMLSGVLAEEGYQVDVAHDGQRALHLALTREHDVLVVDRGLPAVEGVDLVRRLRRQGVAAAVLVLTARGTVADRVEGLDAGADDYLVKPFDLDELLARLRALCRRGADDADVVAVPGAALHVVQRLIVRDGGEAVSLSVRECELFTVLARRPTQVFTRDDLLDLAFGEAESPGAVDTYVHYLRRKLGRGAVVTVRGSGYRLGSL